MSNSLQKPDKMDILMFQYMSHVFSVFMRVTSVGEGGGEGGETVLTCLFFEKVACTDFGGKMP